MIVSNYIATLNDVEVGRCPHEMLLIHLVSLNGSLQVICRMCELPVLRIDGSVGAEKRQKLVDVFNR